MEFESSEPTLKDIDMPIKDKGVFKQVGLDGDSEDTSDLNGYREKVVNKNGSDYRNDKPVSPGYLDEEVIDEGIIDKLKTGVATAAMIFMVAKANAQSPEKLEVLRDASAKSEITWSPEELKGIEDATGITGWSDEAASSIFDNSKEVEAPLRKLEKLDLGKYGHVVKLVGQNHKDDADGLQYAIDISSKGHLDAAINDIKQRNNIPGAKVKVYYRGAHSASRDFTL